MELRFCDACSRPLDPAELRRALPGDEDLEQLEAVVVCPECAAEEFGGDGA